MSLAQIGPCHSMVVNFGYVLLDEFVTFSKRGHYGGEKKPPLWLTFAGDS